MDALIYEIDRLESEILSIIDEIEFFENIQGNVSESLRFKLNRKRKELSKLKDRAGIDVYKNF